MVNKDVTYWDYLHLDKLLSAQDGVESDESNNSNDELHFIIIHQVYELWFKLALREIGEAKTKMSQVLVVEEDLPIITRHLQRVVEIFKLAINQFRLLETMTPQDFLFFRSKLGTASGFQSIQMRELELYLGLDEAQRVSLGKKNVLDLLIQMLDNSPNKAEMIASLKTAKNSLNFKQALQKWLARTPIDGVTVSDPKYSQMVEKFTNAYYQAYCSLQDTMEQGIISANIDTEENIKSRFDSNKTAVKNFIEATDINDEEKREFTKKYRAGLLFIESYRSLPLISWPSKLIESIVELEESLILWRTHHARMVERMIGRRVGTGGSAGVDYLDQTTKYRIFNDLWTVRGILLPIEYLPKLQNPTFYNFAQET